MIYSSLCRSKHVIRLLSPLYFSFAMMSYVCMYGTSLLCTLDLLLNNFSMVPFLTYSELMIFDWIKSISTRQGSSSELRFFNSTLAWFCVNLYCIASRFSWKYIYSILILRLFTYSSITCFWLEIEMLFFCSAGDIQD